MKKEEFCCARRADSFLPLQRGFGLCYKDFARGRNPLLSLMLRSMLHLLLFCLLCGSLCCAQEPDEQGTVQAETACSSEVRERLAIFAALLGQVQDAESASALCGEIERAFGQLLQAGADAPEQQDEEKIAAELEAAFAPVDAELARLEEADFYGVAELRTVFAEPEEGEAADGVIFPVGVFDFLRGGADGGEHHVCPREDGGLPLLNWNEEE